MDVLNLDETLFDEINRRVREFVPLARNLLAEKTDSAAALAQEQVDRSERGELSDEEWKQAGRAVIWQYWH